MGHHSSDSSLSNHRNHNMANDSCAQLIIKKEEIMDFQEENKRGVNHTGIIKWMWWLYVAVGFCVVFIMWWMFMELSSHEVRTQHTEQLQQIEQIEQPGVPNP